MDNDNDIIRQLGEEYQRVMHRVSRYFWLFFLVGAVAGAYFALTTEPPPAPHLPAFFWLLII